MPDEAGAFKKTVNTFLNPLEFDPKNYWSVTGGKDRLMDTLGHAGALGLGYAGVATLLRAFINDIKKRDTEKLRKRVRSNIAAARPVISLDTSTTDTIEEKALDELGTERLEKEESDKLSMLIGQLNKYAEDTEVAAELGKLLDPNTETEVPADLGLWDTVKDLWDSAGISHPWHLAAALGATGLGGYIGYSGTGNIYDRAEKAKLDKNIAKLRNDIDKKLYEEYMQAREAEPAMKTANDPRNPGIARRVGFTAASLYALYATLTGALAYNFARKYSDKNDENRQHLKNIEEFTKRRALSEKAPKFLDLSNLDDSVEEPPALQKRKQLQTQSLAAPKAEALPVDKEDPVAALLG